MRKAKQSWAAGYFLRIRDQDFYLILENVHEIGAGVWI